MSSQSVPAFSELEIEPVVSCRHVTREYTRGTASSRWRFWRRNGQSTTESVKAVDNVSLFIQPGEFVGVAGPSGSGKSTLLHLLGVLDTPTSGTVSFQGQDTSQLSARARTALRLGHVGIIFQRFHLLPSLTARGNVALPLIELGVSRRKRRARANELLAQFGLEDRRTHYPSELSGGEQQRVAIARALATDPTLVIADEPTGELDTDTGETVLTQLRSVAASGHRAVVMATHDRRALAQTDRVIGMLDGRRVQTKQGGGSTATNDTQT